MKKKILVQVVRVFWSLVERDSVYGKKHIIGKRENGRYQSFCKVLFDFSMAPQYMYLNYVNYFDFSMATKFVYVNNILIFLWHLSIYISTM